MDRMKVDLKVHKRCVIGRQAVEISLTSIIQSLRMCAYTAEIRSLGGVSHWDTLMIYSEPGSCEDDGRHRAWDETFITLLICSVGERQMHRHTSIAMPKSKPCS